MRPVTFKEQNKVYVAEGCNDLPAFNDGRQTITKWQFTPAELEELQKNGGCVYLTVLSGPTTPPVLLLTESPFFELQHAEGMSLVGYSPMISAPGKPSVLVWNGIDAPAPKFLKIKNAQYIRDLSIPTRRTQVHVLAPGNYYIRQARPGVEQENFGANPVLCLVEKHGLEGVLGIPDGNK